MITELNILNQVIALIFIAGFGMGILLSMWVYFLVKDYKRQKRFKAKFMCNKCKPIYLEKWNG